MAAHTHWRITCDGLDYVQLAEVTFLSAGLTDLSVGGTASASSEYSAAFPASAAFDKDASGSWWCTAPGSLPAWLAYAHPTAVEPVYVSITAHPTYPPISLGLQHSDDGITWSAAVPLIFSSGGPIASGAATVFVPSVGSRPIVWQSNEVRELPAGDKLPADVIPSHGHAMGDVAGLDAALGAKEASIAAGATTQYFRGDKTWRTFMTDVRATVLTGLSTATNAVITASDTVLSALGKLQKQVSDNLTTLTSHTGNTSNPHGVTKAQVGLGNVDNTADSAKPVSTAQQTALDTKQATLVSGTNIKTVNGNSLLGGGDLSITAGITDAPSDGKSYGRKDGAWSEIVSGAGGITRVTRTSDTQLVAADSGKWIDITSGTFTQTFAATATLGSGWFCYIKNSGAGDITLDPNSAETIDGLANFVLYPGAARLVLCDGAALHSIPLVGGTKTYTTTGSYVWAPGVQQWDADLIAGGAGGGGGARAATRCNGGGGGAGERWKTTIALSEVTVGASVTCTVGAKGIGGAAATGDNLPVNKIVGQGTAGGESSIGALRSVAGGTHDTNGGATLSHGDGPRGGGKGAAGANDPGAGNYYPAKATQVTEWAGPHGRAGDDSGVAIQALLGGQRGGRSGAAVAAGVAGANGTNPGDGGYGGAGNLNGSAAGKGGDGADGKITIVEVI